MRSVKKLLYTTLVLTLTSFLMKTVAVWFNVYLTDRVGSIGIGIFQLILSVYALAKTLACGGMNLAATRLCIDDFTHARFAMKKITACALVLGVFSASLLFVLSDFISRRWIGTADASAALKILAASLPFIALSASLNGYMTAARKMSRYSVIQLSEQFARIAITIYILAEVYHTTLRESIALISFGITASEVISFFLALTSYGYDRRKMSSERNRAISYAKKLFRIAFPDAIGSYLRSALNTVEHLLIPIGIRKSGASVDRAFSDYGAVQGMALPILLYPSSILGVVSSLLVPEIAECKAKQNEVQVQYMINRVLSLAILFSVGAMAILYGFSEELSIAIYDSGEAAKFIRWLAPLVPVMYLDMATDGMLKGLDRQLTIMKINILDSVLCVILVWILIPKISIEGYLVTIYVAEIVNFVLSFATLASETHLRLKPGKTLLKPLVSAGLSVGISRQFLAVTEKPTPNLLISISVGLVLYLLFLRISGAISKDDSAWLKGLIKP